MMDDFWLFAPLLIAGWLLIGIILWLFFKNYFSKGYLSESEVREQYISRLVYEQLQLQHDTLKTDLSEKEDQVITVSKILSAREQDVLHLEERLTQQKEELETMQKRLRSDFENLANQILEQKSAKFTQQNQIHLQQILSPLKEKIKEFEQNIHQKYMDETKERVSLKREIELLKDLNLQLSEDAANLVSALKGDSKTQGDWGEYQLKTLLEKAGLQEGIHFFTQRSFTDEQQRQKRPDFIIHLPQDKQLIIDSKVSLKAYEQYFNASDEGQRTSFLNLHIESIRNHIKDLSRKNYSQLYQINTPDYLLLFIPIEPAFSVALQRENELFVEALERNIVLVTTSTLLATMRTVAFIWNQEKQTRNVLEIARQSGLLYDKFVNFVTDLKEIGQRLSQTQSAYANAMNKLTDAARPGDTLIGKAQKIKELGAKSTKEIPRDMLD